MINDAISFMVDVRLNLHYVQHHFLRPQFDAPGIFSYASYHKLDAHVCNALIHISKIPNPGYKSKKMVHILNLYARHLLDLDRLPLLARLALDRLAVLLRSELALPVGRVSKGDVVQRPGCHLLGLVYEYESYE